MDSESYVNEKVFRYKMKESFENLCDYFRLWNRLKNPYNCCRRFYASPSFFVDDWGRCYLKGLQHCKARAFCPVCSLKAQKDSLDQIRQGIINARKKGLYVCLVTYNFSHHKVDELPIIQAAFGLAKQNMYRNGSFRRFIKNNGYIGRITDYEVQLCGDNGYHPHSHDLEFFNNDIDLDLIKDKYVVYYLNALNESGLYAKEDVAVDVLDYKGVGDYVTKLSSEMTLHLQTKDSWSNSLSPLRCLKAYMQTDDLFYGSYFMDYVLNVRGKRILGWSRDLKGFLGVVNEKIEKEDDDFIFVVNNKDFDKLNRVNWFGMAADLSCGNVDDCFDHLKRLSISYTLNESALYMMKNVLN